MKVRNILSYKTGKLITIGPDQTLKEVVTILATHNIGALVVADNQKLVGIISERDLVRLAAQHENPLPLRVGDVMTRDVVVGAPNDDILAVAHTMTERRFRHLPILEGDKLVGMISIGDVLKAQRDQYQGEIDTLTHIITTD